MMFRFSVVLAATVVAAVPVPTARDLVAQSRAKLAAGDFAGAYTLAQTTVAKFPDDANAVLLAGNFVRDRYGLTAALPWYDRALALEPGKVTALLEKAATLGDAGRTVEMLRVTRQVLEIDAANPVAFFMQAVLAARAGKWELARALYYRTGAKVDSVPAVMLLRGAIGVQTGSTESAIAALAPLVAQFPAHLGARRLLGLALFRAGDAQGAIDTLKPIANTGDAWAQMLMARACELVGDRSGAAILLDRAAAGARADVPTANVAEATGAANVRFNPGTAFALIDALNRAGNADAASQVMTTLVVQYPASLPALRLAASDALVRGEWGRAATALRLVRMRGGDGDALMLGGLGWARFNLGRSDEARDLAARAYALAPANAAVAANYGWFRAKAGDRPGGVALLKKAVAIAPDYAPFRAKLAEAQR